MSKEKRRVPKLRFPGFTEDWEQRKFGEIMTFLNGRAYKQDELLEDGKYKVLRVGNFYTNDSWYYSDLELDDKYYAMNGDLLYTWSATFGPHIWKGEKVIYHYHIWKLVLQDKIDKLFALQLLEVDKANIMSDKNGSTMVHITKQGMENKQTILPISLNEQKQIAKFLSSMDKLITLHQRKLNNLKLKKKALFQKLFPKNGERYPELRFPGFTDAWEQRKLSEVTTCFDNLRVAVTASDRVPGKIPYYGANGIQDYVSGHTHSGEFVLIAEDGANDLNDYPIQYVNGAIWVNNHAHVIAGYKEKLENNFLSYSLKTVKMTTFIVGGGRSKLNLKALLEIPISMPNYDEQCVIGEFIETIDKNITLHQRKLDHLQLQKKALLQQMFV